jgi:hypothetical protein
MAYSENVIENYFDLILERIENGDSLRKALSLIQISSQTFYKWIENDESKSKRYARACELRADSIFEDILDIADDSSQDVTKVDIGDGVEVEKVNSEIVQRSRLRVDARKWILAKMNPKKYGDKLDIDHSTLGEKIVPPITWVKPDESDTAT